MGLDGESKPTADGSLAAYETRVVSQFLNIVRRKSTVRNVPSITMTAGPGPARVFRPHIG